jgi:predicted Rdx family selenoprotein
MAAEFWSTFGADVALTITPVGEGRLEIYMDCKKLLDRKEEGGTFPDLRRVKQLKKVIQERIAAVPA